MDTYGSVGVKPISSAIARCLALRWLSDLLTAGAAAVSGSGDWCLLVWGGGGDYTRESGGLVMFERSSEGVGKSGWG